MRRIFILRKLAFAHKRASHSLTTDTSNRCFINETGDRERARGGRNSSILRKHRFAHDRLALVCTELCRVRNAHLTPWLYFQHAKKAQPEDGGTASLETAKGRRT